MQQRAGQRRVSRPGAAVLLLTVLLTGCSSGGLPGSRRTGGALPVVATTDVWGSLLAQLGGAHVSSRSLIRNPNVDPHSYEPTPGDARTLAAARVVVVNGVGYDAWAAKALAAQPVPGRRLVDVGATVGVPADGNPHRWYAPDDVDRSIDAITAALVAVDPADAADFRRLHDDVRQHALGGYHQLLRQIRDTYRGVPVAASESIAAPLCEWLGLDLRTPASLLRAVSEGTGITAGDLRAQQGLLAGRAVRVYLDNTQNSTPDIQRQVELARAHGIPVVPLTETLTPQGASFQDWQTRQLRALRDALHEATGR